MVNEPLVVESLRFYCNSRGTALEWAAEKWLWALTNLTECPSDMWVNIYKCMKKKCLIWVYTVCSGLSDQIHTIQYNVWKGHVQTGKSMTKCTAITNRLSITTGLIIIFSALISQPYKICSRHRSSVLGKISLGRRFT